MKKLGSVVVNGRGQNNLKAIYNIKLDILNGSACYLAYHKYQIIFAAEWFHNFGF